VSLTVPPSWRLPIGRSRWRELIDARANEFRFPHVWSASWFC
jgi:hypothetical protein